MPITETWLKANSGKPREKVEEKSDRDSLSARVSAKGKITFQIRFRFDGKGARIDLGSYPLISLKEAREKALEVRSLIEKFLSCLYGSELVAITPPTALYFLSCLYGSELE